MAKTAGGISHRLKEFLGVLPYTAELYWQLRQPGKPVTPRFDLHRLKKHLPEWRDSAIEATQKGDGEWDATPRRRVLMFATQRYWIEHVTLLGMALAAQGHKVMVAYTPYAEWQKPLNRFDVRRQNLYAQEVLRLAEPVLQIIPLLGLQKTAARRVARRGSGSALPADLEAAIQLNALRDTQYTQQMEQVDPESALYKMRLARNREAAQTVLDEIKLHQPEVVIIPNGTILEFGAVYQTARFLGVPVVTYEFGEQRQRIWLAHDSEVMRQNTSELWAARGEQSLTEAQWEQIRTLFTSRQKANLWNNFSLRWQGVPSEGGEKVRASLGLDTRPVVLLATNVIGDSLTLGRQVFSDSMTEWLERTVKDFASRTDVQLVIRIHPGETFTKGPSVADVVRRALPVRHAERASDSLPENIRLITADAKVNSYDIFEIADLGLVYTTTAGLEMAMSGVPVIVVGNTHYRDKGFTLDPDSWEAYFAMLERVLASPAEYRLSRLQVDRAWAYSYRFFFEYPLPFPWHVVRFWEDVQQWPLERVLGGEGQALFAQTFRYLAGEMVKW